MDQYASNFCRNVLYIRHINKLSRQEMSQVLGISVSTLSKIERGEWPFRITATMLSRLSDYSGETIERILKCDLTTRTLALEKA